MKCLVGNIVLVSRQIFRTNIKVYVSGKKQELHLYKQDLI